MSNYTYTLATEAAVRPARDRSALQRFCTWQAAVSIFCGSIVLLRSSSVQHSLFACSVREIVEGRVLRDRLAHAGLTWMNAECVDPLRLLLNFALIFMVCGLIEHMTWLFESRFSYFRVGFLGFGIVALAAMMEASVMKSPWNFHLLMVYPLSLAAIGAAWETCRHREPLDEPEFAFMPLVYVVLLHLRLVLGPFTAHLA